MKFSCLGSHHFLVFMLFCSTFFLVQCSSNKQPHASHPAKSIYVSTHVDSTFPVEYAQGFSVSMHQGCIMVNVFNPFQHHSDTLRYKLVPRGKVVPQTKIQAQLIRTPVRSMIITSTTHLALAEMLHLTGVIKGMVGAKYAYSSKVRKQVQSGAIKSFSSGHFNNEVALNMHPDLVMISAGQTSQYNRYKLLVNSGIAVFVNADWLETTPLGRAEWVKVMGLLLNKEKRAQKKFKKVTKRYNQLKNRAANADKKPLVINNLPYKDAWFVSGGDSYTAQYYKDANVNYPWFNNQSTGGLHLSFETVYQEGLKADVWLNPGTAETKGDILAKDARFKDFKSFQTDRIYNKNKRKRKGGGNDFWETGVVRPDLVLADLIKILHPDVLKSDSLYFYQKVE